MTKFIDYLRGKKVNIIAIVGALYGVLDVFNIINISTEQKTALATLGLALLALAFRDAIKNK
jgi:small-conductance mechanosensitive channel